MIFRLFCYVTTLWCCQRICVLHVWNPLIERLLS